MQLLSLSLFGTSFPDEWEVNARFSGVASERDKNFEIPFTIDHDIRGCPTTENAPNG